MECKISEEWKDIPGYEGIYQASNLGRIRSVDGKTTFNKLRGEVHWKQRIIKQHYMRHKRKNDVRFDAKCTLWKDGKPHYYLTARLIAMTWCDGYSEELTVNHIDCDSTNNNASNLEWVTIGDNVRKALEDGLMSNQHCSCVIITKDKKVEAFKTFSSASRYIGKNESYISGLFKSSNRSLIVDNKLILPVLKPYSNSEDVSRRVDSLNSDIIKFGMNHISECVKNGDIKEIYKKYGICTQCRNADVDGNSNYCKQCKNKLDSIIESRKKRQKAIRDKLRKEGRCFDCGKPTSPGHIHCEACLRKRLNWARRDRHKQREQTEATYL